MMPQAALHGAAGLVTLVPLIIHVLGSLASLSIILAFGARTCRPASALRVALACLALLLGLAGCIVLRISFSRPGANVAAILVAVGVYHLLAAMAWAVRSVWLRLLALSVGYAPIVLAWMVFLSYRMVIVFVSVFLLGEYMAPPQEKAQLPSGLFCLRMGGGAAFTDEGYTVHSYAHPFHVPVLKREVLSVTVNESEPDGGPDQASCRSVFADYQPHHPAGRAERWW